MAERRLIGTALLVTAATLTLAEVQRREELPEISQYIGLAVSFFVLSAIADLGGAPIGAGLAMLVMVTVLLARGEAALTYATGWGTKRVGKERKTVRESAGGRKFTRGEQARFAAAPDSPQEPFFHFGEFLDQFGGN